MTYSLINNGDSGLDVRTILNSVLTDINDGVIGSAGSSGSSGVSGSSGSSGVSGSSGTSGIDGTSGTSGESGSSGTSGIDGTSGTSGIDGTSGTSGQDGTSGTSGTTFSYISEPTDEVLINPTTLTVDALYIYMNGEDILISPSASLTIGNAYTLPLYNGNAGDVLTTDGMGQSDWIAPTNGSSGTSGINGTSGTSGTSGTTPVDGKTFQTLTAGSSVTWTYSSGYNAKINLDSDVNSISITGATNGDYGTLLVNNANNKTLSFGTSSVWRFAGNTYSITGGTGSKVDVFTWVYDGTNFFVNFNKNF
jgi:hypothetical protein